MPSRPGVLSARQARGAVPVMSFHVVPAVGDVLERVLDDTFPLWNDGLSRAALRQGVGGAAQDAVGRGPSRPRGAGRWSARRVERQALRPVAAPGWTHPARAGHWRGVHRRGLSRPRRRPRVARAHARDRRHRRAGVRHALLGDPAGVLRAAGVRAGAADRVGDRSRSEARRRAGHAGAQRRRARPAEHHRDVGHPLRRRAAGARSQRGLRALRHHQASGCSRASRRPA